MKRRRRRILILGIAGKLLGTALVMGILFLRIFGLAMASGNEMYPAIRTGDVLLYYRSADLLNSAAVIYEVHGEDHLGRIEAVNGSVISRTEDGQLTIDGNYQPIQEREGIYQKTMTDPDETLSLPLTVPEGEYFILCDDRSRYTDSRTYGPVPESAIRGRIITVIRRRTI